MVVDENKQEMLVKFAKFVFFYLSSQVAFQQVSTCYRCFYCSLIYFFFLLIISVTMALCFINNSYNKAFWICNSYNSLLLHGNDS